MHTYTRAQLLVAKNKIAQGTYGKLTSSTLYVHQAITNGVDWHI